MTDKKMTLTSKVLLGMALGILVGLGINYTGSNAEGTFVGDNIVNGLFSIVGTMFINALKMLVVPLVFFSLLSGVLGIGNINALGKVGGKSFALYMLTTALAIALGISLAALLGIGEGMNLPADVAFSAKEAPPLSSVLIDIIPTNIMLSDSVTKHTIDKLFMDFVTTGIWRTGNPLKKVRRKATCNRCSTPSWTTCRFPLATQTSRCKC